jgi:predicted ATPase
MKILDFQPGTYRNLPQRAVHFSRQPETMLENGCSIRFLVGKNGTGKTNILRFLASIFLAIEEDYRRPRPNSPAYTIPYRLVYELHGTQIEINSKGKGRSGVTFTIGDEKLRDAGDIPSRDLILPANVLIYTSGDYRDWQNLFQPGSPEEEKDNENTDVDWNTRRPEDERPPNWVEIQIEPKLSESDFEDPNVISAEETSIPENLPDIQGSSAMFDIVMPRGFLSSYRRVTLVGASQLKIALLAALLDNQQHNRETSALHDALSEVNVRLLAFSLQVHLTDAAPIYREQLSDLYSFSSQPIQQWEDQLWVYDLNLAEPLSGKTVLQRLTEKLMESPFNFYQMLVNLQENGILRQANLVIEYTPDNRSGQARRVLLSDDLSDGEFAFLSRMGLIYLLNEKECLFLLDEPEVHFNDDWKRNLVDSIERALTIPEKTESEVILTSHASIVLTDAYPDEIILMTYLGQEDNIPLTFAAEQGEVLRILFDSERSVGRRAMRNVEDVIKNGSIQDLEALLEQVGPGYYRFKIVKELQSRVPPTEQDDLPTPQ